MSRRGSRAIIFSMSGRKRVLIAGGGVAALEAALTLRELAADLVEVELVAPERKFWYRPLAVAEPFGQGQARSFDLDELARRCTARFTLGTIARVDARGHFAQTRAGDKIPYDSLLLACGAVPRAVITGALTFRGPADTMRISDVLARIDAGGVTHLVVAVPHGVVWSLPAYELALLLAAHVAVGPRDDVRIALVTPEDEPLLVFGSAARDAIRALLDEHKIALHTGFSPVEFRDGELRALPAQSIPADCVVALPSLRGPRIDGIPQTRYGFVPVDPHGQVSGLSGVWAAGDLTLFPIKQGGLAAQQADAAAEAIAAAAGAPIDPQPFRPVLRGLLLTGKAPRYLRRDVAAGEAGIASVDALWWPPAKLVGRRLAPLLADLAGAPAEVPDHAGGGVAVERELRPEELAHAQRPRVDEEDDGSGTVAGVMTTRLLVVAPEDTLGEVAERMSTIDFGSGVVADHGRLIGILTSRDLLRAFAGRVHSSEARVREWMTAEPIVAQPSSSLASALRLMHEHSIHHLPVVENERAVGMVGMREVAQALAERRSRPHVGLGL
jgi:sulfide:quinone oxidoreductase